MKALASTLVILTLFGITHVIGQENLRIGHVNVQEIMQQLPETDSVKLVMERESKEMENLYVEMIKEHENNLKEYESKKDAYSEFIKTSKEKDLMEMSSKIQQFQQNANQQLQKRNMELIQPLYTKINEAINSVSLKNSFTYVLDLSSGTVSFHSPTSHNLNESVLQELGVSNH
jgi:outer membrane protein